MPSTFSATIMLHSTLGDATNTTCFRLFLIWLALGMVPKPYCDCKSFYFHCNFRLKGAQHPRNTTCQAVVAGFSARGIPPLGLIFMSLYYYHQLAASNQVAPQARSAMQQPQLDRLLISYIQT